MDSAEHDGAPAEGENVVALTGGPPDGSRGNPSLLASVRQAAFTDDGALLFVNSGLDPSRPIDTQRAPSGGAAISSRH